MSQLPSAQRETWGTRVGVILAVAGSAVGLGNFLRFPGLAAEYGGGAFMIPYIIAFLLLGLPIAWVEWSLGRYGGRHGFNSLAGVFFSISRNRAAPYFGVLGLLIPVMIYMFYIYVAGWCLGYAWFYATGRMDLGGDPEAYGEFFAGFVGAEADGAAFLSPLQSPLGFVVIAFILNFILIYRGVTRGIEWFCKWAMPVLVLLAGIVLVRVLTLPPVTDGQQTRTVLDGLGYMWNPDLAALADPEIWLAAAGQVFFSLSVGFGIIVTYASYMRADDDVALSSVTAASGNGFCEVSLAGMMIVPAGFLFLGLEFVQDPPGTFGMGFVALPNVFEQMPAGRLFGFLFFALLFLAAMTSTLSMLQPAIAFLEEGLGLGRRSSVALLGFITFIGAAFVIYFSEDFTALATIDFWVATLGIYLLATVLVIMYGWVLGIDKGLSELARGAEIPIPLFVRYLIKYIAPIYLLTIFAFWLYNEFVARALDPEQPSRFEQVRDNEVVQMSIGLILVVLALFLLLIAQAVRRWRDAERQGAEAMR